ncbi:MAG: DoxX family protein [Acidimicrobiia bacterium]
MNRLLWVLQIILGLYFIAVGVIHFVVPEGLPAQMQWMYDLSDTLHTFSGIAEILGGLGLILPAVTGIRPELVAYAAFGLGLVMVGAVIWHLGRGEATQTVLNVINIAVLVFVGYGRLRLRPLPPRSG